MMKDPEAGFSMTGTDTPGIVMVRLCELLPPDVALKIAALALGANGPSKHAPPARDE